MYRILIADDEGIMVESLRSMILHKYPDTCEVETAKTGRAAIEQAEFFHPDIIFMDIQMPGINGIQAMKEIRTFNRTVLLYVISAYDKFDYAAEAISSGVERYLTKPLSKKTFLETMDEALKKVDELRRKQDDQLRVQEKLETVIPVVEAGYVGSVMMPGEMQEGSYYRQLLEIREEYAFASVFWFGSEIRDGRLISSVRVGVDIQDIFLQFRAILKSYLRCMIGPVVSSRILVIVPVERDSAEYEDRIRNIEQMRRVLERLEERTGLQYRVGIGRIHRMDEVKTSYQEAIQALSAGSSQVVHINDIGREGIIEDDFPQEIEKQLFTMLRRGDMDGMRDQANLFFDWMIRRYPESRNNIRLKVLEHVMLAERDAFREGVLNYGFKSRTTYLSEVMASDDYEQLREWYLHKLGKVCGLIRDQREQQSGNVILRAKNYITEHFDTDISLDDVSREVNISPYYFSKLFKEESGENFIEYLTRIRIDAAKEMLQEGDLSIREISQRAGYSDPNYFSRTFKKQTGMTPREYREKENPRQISGR